MSPSSCRNLPICLPAFSPYFPLIFPFMHSSMAQQYDAKTLGLWHCVCVQCIVCMHSTPALSWGAPREHRGIEHKGSREKTLNFSPFLPFSSLHLPWPLLRPLPLSPTSPPPPPFFSFLHVLLPCEVCFPSILFLSFFGMIMMCLYVDLPC